MSRLLCWLKYRPNLFGIAPIEGHSYYETYQNNDVQILKCMDCGKYSIGYYNGGEPKPYSEDTQDEE